MVFNSDDNIKRLRSKGTMIDVDTGLAKEIKRLASICSELGHAACNNRLSKVEDLMSANVDHLCAGMAVTGTSYEAVKSLVKTSSGGKLAKYEARLLDIMQYDQWSGSLWSSSVRLLRQPQRLGIARLLLRGRKQLHQLADRFAFLEYCDVNNIRDAASTSPRILETLCKNWLAGSHTCKKGKLIESLITDVVKDLGLVCRNQVKLHTNSRIMDMVINEKIVVEITYPTATSSSISDKTKSIIAEAVSPKNKDKIFVFLGGGTAWSNRPEDENMLAKNVDFCFGETQEQLLEFMYFLIQSNQVKISKSKIKRMLQDKRLISVL